MHFELDENQIKRLREWEAEQDAIALAEQKKSTNRNSFAAIINDECNEPYYGATGGSLTYEFTPNSIGMVIVVKHGYTKAELDLSDYDNW